MAARSSLWGTVGDTLLDRGGRSLGIEYALGAGMIACLAWAASIAAMNLGSLGGLVGFVAIALSLSWWVAPLWGIPVGLMCAFFADGFAFSRDGAIDLESSFLLLAAVGSAACVLVATTGTARRRRKDRIKASDRVIKDPSVRTRTVD